MLQVSLLNLWSKEVQVILLVPLSCMKKDFQITRQIFRHQQILLIISMIQKHLKREISFAVWQRHVMLSCFLVQDMLIMQESLPKKKNVIQERQSFFRLQQTVMLFQLISRRPSGRQFRCIGLFTLALQRSLIHGMLIHQVVLTSI